MLVSYIEQKHHCLKNTINNGQIEIEREMAQQGLKPDRVLKGGGCNSFQRGNIIFRGKID